MDKPQSNQLYTQDAGAVALRTTGSQVGHAAGIEQTARRVGSTAVVLDPPSTLQLWLNEVFGLLFVLLSSIYIFVVPETIVREGLVRGVMRHVVKRAVDIVGAVLGLIITSPLWIIIPVLIKLSSPGPVFYTQMRVGENRRRRDRRFHRRAVAADRRQRERRREDYLGRPFKMIKFRTMVVDAERMSGPVWAQRNDPRVTWIGGILRKTRLDEIPQFLNVLKGEMSLVGPRPERPAIIRELATKIDRYAARLQVKPGLTGLAQVENGYDNSLESVARKVSFDLQYIREWSLWQDFKILCRTLVVVVTGRGAC